MGSGPGPLGATRRRQQWKPDSIFRESPREGTAKNNTSWGGKDCERKLETKCIDDCDRGKWLPQLKWTSLLFKSRGDWRQKKQEKLKIQITQPTFQNVLHNDIHSQSLNFCSFVSCTQFYIRIKVKFKLGFVWKGWEIHMCIDFDKSMLQLWQTRVTTLKFWQSVVIMFSPWKGPVWAESTR